MQRKLTAGGAAAPGVTYTTVMTRLDELVTPWASGFMQNAGATNNVLQDICPGDASEHVLVAVDPSPRSSRSTRSTRHTRDRSTATACLP
jgi:hypothetical protein